MNIPAIAPNLAGSSRAFLLPHHACLRPEKTTRAHDFPDRVIQKCNRNRLGMHFFRCCAFPIIRWWAQHNIYCPSQPLFSAFEGLCAHFADYGVRQPERKRETRVRLRHGGLLLAAFLSIRQWDDISVFLYLVSAKENLAPPFIYSKIGKPEESS